MEHYAAWSLLPTALVVVVALWLHRPAIALICGVIVGLAMLDSGELIGNFAALTTATLQDETVAWVIAVCGLMGSLIFLLIRTGAATAFANRLAEHANTRRRALLVTWLLGIIIFIDDYLNAIAISASMKKVTDRYRVSRSMLSYVVDSTAAPVCVIVPISTWAVFFAALLEQSGAAASGEGLALYITAIPYMFYAWIAMLLVPLVVIGRVPLWGAMRRAEAAAASGRLALTPVAEIEERGEQRSDLWAFLLPLLALIGFSWAFDIDLLKGVMVTLALTIPYLIARRLINLRDALDACMDGFKMMMAPLAIVFFAFMFKSVNDQLGLSLYVIESVQPLMTPLLLPLIVFLTMAAICFATGSSWGVFAIAIPIVMPLGAAMGVEPALLIGALLSASSFGSHACFYSDSTALVAQSAGCGVMEHALSQLPYALLAALLAGLAFVAIGL
ncbi:sodium:proton antiporter [Gammaproteobacteria bacterium LSUCC0057]|uniref:Sodium:proton antiporter n=1 Tax=Gammaproteobacteria bacterium LSUCC0057 TaxID=2559237 RepID=A0A4Y8UJY6_9GAMM|nr:sodium:proton antiporter [Gammaproteobacteria bacterium LSUCC0057]